MIRDISFELVENCPLGTVVGNIKIAAELFLFKNVDLALENGDYFEDFSRDHRVSKNLFKIDNRTSDLVTVRSIDREVICRQTLLKSNENCTILQIVSVNKLMWINVNIRILDVNDNHPTFRKPFLTLTLSEISKVHSTIQLDEPIDLDSSAFRPLRYSLEPISKQSPQFRLQRDPLKLVLLKSLDYEATQVYTMTIIACDAGVPALCGNQTLVVNVINENDESPVFLRSNYTAIINEDASVGQVVLQPKAFDRDAGDYGKVKYSISNEYELAKIYFSINADTGNLIIKEKFLNPTKFKFSIEAKDEAPNPLIGRTWIYLHIVDVNNNSPVIQINPIDASIVRRSNNHTILEVTENNKVPLNLAFITVTDDDQGENARCMCQLQSHGDQLQLISVNEISDRNIYRLATTKVFDAEALMKIAIKILCNDHGEPQNLVIHEIEVRIKDENEYPPTFDQSIYEVEVMENISIGVVVKTIKVYDRDAWHLISLEITAPGSSYFEIGASGTLTTKSAFDYEKLKHMEFHITAFDRGIKSFTSSVRVSVIILDVNDNAPEFEPNSNHFEVFENLVAPSKIGQVRAFDKDSLKNALLQYHLLNTSNDAQRNVDQLNLFYLNQSTGDIHSQRSLDYEHGKMYILLVKVVDSGKPPLSNVQSIYVHVKDTNDNGPFWQYPNNEDNILNISMHNIRDSIVTRVRAVDKDGDQYNTVFYYLLSHDDLLSIDKLTGVITLRQKTLPSGVISVLLRAVDAKSSDKHTSQSLIMYIQNDDNYLTRLPSFRLTLPVLTSIIGVSSLLSILLVIALFFFCCRKRRICKACSSSQEVVESKYDFGDLKNSNQQLKVMDIPLDLVTDNDGGNNNTVEDSVKLMFGSVCPSLNTFFAENNQDFDKFDPMNKDLFLQINSKDAQQNDSNYYGFSSALISLPSPYNSHIQECCVLHSSSDEDSSRYLEEREPPISMPLQSFHSAESTDCMINSYATFVKCVCGSATNAPASSNPAANKTIAAPFFFNGSAWIPTESLTGEDFIVQSKRDTLKLMPLKSIMKKTPSSFVNADSSSSSGQCNDTDQASSACDSGCVVGSPAPRSVNLIDKTYQCKKSQV